MPNPFKELLNEQTPYDEWGGAFTCKEPGCWKAATIARYYFGERKLVWNCPDGHESVNLDVDP